MLSDKLITLANNTEKVFNAGYNKALKENPPGATEEELEEKYNEGYNNGYSEGRDIWYQNGLSQGREEGRAEGRELGISEGKQAEYDDFWDAYQNNGKRTDYTCGFAGAGWNELNFKPKYKIKPQNAYMMFRYNTMQIDLVKYLALLGVELDFSSAWQMMYCFADSKFTKVGVVDVRGCNGSNATYLFQNSTILKTIKLLKVKDTTNFTNDFGNCTALESITIEGTIGKGVSWGDCTLLNKASIESIFNALSATTSGLTVTLSKIAVNNAFGIDVDDPTTYPEGSEYYALRQSKSNWNIYYYE